MRTQIQKNKNSLIENFPNLSYLYIETNKRNTNFSLINQSYKIPNPNIQNSVENSIQLSQNKFKQKSEKNTNLIDENNSENSQEKKEDIHRRSLKNDKERRTFICQLCGKSYLSYPALYTHRKQ